MNLVKKVRFTALFLSAIIQRESKLIILGLFLGILSFFVIPKLIQYLPSPGKTEKVGLVGQFAVEDLPQEILENLSYGLTKISDKGEILPGLATSWEVKNEGRTYVFKVKTDGISWHDNKIFQVKDINYNLKDIVISFDNNEITFNLNEPFAPFPSILAKPLFRRGLIGLGDYQLKRIDKKGKFIKSILLTSLAEHNLPNKLYRFYNNENELKTAFNLGEINTLSGILNLEGLFLAKGTQTKEVILKGAYLGVIFDTGRPPMADKSFRQALAYALPKEGVDRRALGPLNPDSWAYNPDVKPYKEDLVHAKQLLENESVKDTKITISSFPQYEALAGKIKESWQKLGVTSEVKIVSFVPENFDVLLVAREIPKEPDQYYFWHSTQKGNLSNLKNPRIDKLLEDGRKNLSKEERKNIYFDFQRFLVEESPVIFLSHPVVYNVTR